MLYMKKMNFSDDDRSQDQNQERQTEPKLDGASDDEADDQSDQIYSEIPQFERFLKIVGFKQIEGTIYGYLSLTDHHVTSEEISTALGLSQGAVSQALNRLSHWGAVESRYESEKRAQVHQATVDQLRLVASIFLKREKEAIASFKDMAERSIILCRERGDSDANTRIQRLNSIVLTCRAAETVMDFIIGLSKLGVQKKYAQVFKSLPRALDILVEAVKMEQKIEKKVTAAAQKVCAGISEKLTAKISTKITDKLTDKIRTIRN